MSNKKQTKKQVHEEWEFLSKDELKLMGTALSKTAKVYVPSEEELEAIKSELEEIAKESK